MARGSSRGPVLLTPAARRAVRQRMLLLRSAPLERLSLLTGVSVDRLHRFHHELADGGLPDTLLARGATGAFTRELPQALLLYLLIRAHRPQRVVETGVRPGYSTAWILAGMDANGVGELTSVGPGSTLGRPNGVTNVAVGQFVPPALRTRWTLVLGSAEDRLRDVLAERPTDVFFSDSFADPARFRFEVHHAWTALSRRGILLAHHVDANSVWSEFCRLQGAGDSVLDPGPPALGALSVTRAQSAVD